MYSNTACILSSLSFPEIKFEMTLKILCQGTGSYKQKSFWNKINVFDNVAFYV